MQTDARESQRRARRYDLWFVSLLAVLSAVQLCVLAWSPFDLAPDEAHYWEWSRRLDYGYYSKGPAIAWTIAAATAPKS